MKIESRKCINISKNCRIPFRRIPFRIPDDATKLPQIHAVRGCDTTSFLHGVGKIKVSKNV